MKKLQSNRKSKPQFFNKLPSEIVIDILSRLPIRTIIISKCVCRSWRDLLCSRDFIDIHLSKSVPGLIFEGLLFQSKFFRIFEYDDADRGVPYKLIRCMKPLRSSSLEGSVNGLLLRRIGTVQGDWEMLIVCNPITREYIELNNYGRFQFLPYWPNRLFTYGIGVSRMTGQYKVVSILHDHDLLHTDLSFRISMSICLVYTLGTGMWRAITPPPPFVCNFCLCVSECQSAMCVSPTR